ncbi:NAD(P)-binding protein [Auriculariales sp. MPI-PUGE-AT-0066]|nr:NAD(P)-binding protein [Auriculariales sp. MPI-PUGE-AT-0066]
MAASHSEFKFDTTGDEVVSAFTDRVAGRIFLVTGPNPTGIGATTITSLAKAKPQALILAGRSTAKFQPIVDEVNRIDPSIKVVSVTLDLSSQASVRQAAKDILENADVPRIDTIINNAAVMACPLDYTAEGIELQFGTNHIGHFLLTNLLMPKLRASAEPVVVNLTSSGHRFYSSYDDVNWKTEKYDIWTAYGIAKVANIHFTKSLNERGIRAIAVHPGWVMSDLARHVDQSGLGTFLERAQATSDFDPLDFQKNLAQGCSSTLVAALDPAVSNGAYMRDCQVAVPAPFANDASLPPKLWKLSNELVGERFA